MLENVILGKVVNIFCLKADSKTEKKNFCHELKIMLFVEINRCLGFILKNSKIGTRLPKILGPSNLTKFGMKTVYAITTV